MHKNWKEICKISDTHVMWAFTLLNMDSNLGRKFIERFPEYFTQEQQSGPYPLSVMRKKARERGLEQGSKNGEKYIVSFDGAPKDIPVETFDKYGNYVVGDGFPQKLPAGIDPEAQQGEIVTWEGKQFVVLENNENCEELYIAPAEFVYIDCKEETLVKETNIVSAETKESMDVYAMRKLLLGD